MGSLSSRPKAPATQIVYVPSAGANSVPASSETGGASSNDAESVSAQTLRNDSLLRRQRGRAGTVLTSYRGVLNSGSNKTAGRKTLLGE